MAATKAANVPEIEVIKDFDGYFEARVRGWVHAKLEQGKEFKHKKIIVDAGPYRMGAVSYVSNEREGTLLLDFYSALRRGFGELTDRDVHSLIELL